MKVACRELYALMDIQYPAHVITKVCSRPKQDDQHYGVFKVVDGYIKIWLGEPGLTGF